MADECNEEHMRCPHLIFITTTLATYLLVAALERRSGTSLSPKFMITHMTLIAKII